MEEIGTVGLDIAKSSFQVHAVGEVVVRRQLRRRQVLSFFSRLSPCLIGMESCATSHYWARELIGLGHEERLMPPRYVKSYVKRNKNDAADAEAICEAVTRPTMRFVPIKTVEQQSVLMVHRNAGQEGVDALPAMGPVLGTHSEDVEEDLGLALPVTDFTLSVKEVAGTASAKMLINIASTSLRKRSSSSPGGLELGGVGQEDFLEDGREPERAAGAGASRKARFD